MKQICRTIIALSLFVTFCPAYAQHVGPYLGGYLGGNLLTPAKSSDDMGSFNLTFNKALQESAVLGWNFESGTSIGEGRAELEYSHRSNRLDQVEFAEGSFKGEGDLQVDSLILNSFGEFRSKSFWTPYLGAGVGAARLSASNLSVTGQPLASDSAIVLAYQLGCGVEFELSKHFRLDLGYRFFGTTRPAFRESNGHTFKMDYFNHSAVLGLLFGF
jgi:opacity protein-like surface antigen